jgi:hypothetical protein
VKVGFGERCHVWIRPQLVREILALLPESEEDSDDGEEQSQHRAALHASLVGPTLLGWSCMVTHLPLL